MAERWRSKVRLFTWLENNPYDRTTPDGIIIPAGFYVVWSDNFTGDQRWMGISRHLVLHPWSTFLQMQAAWNIEYGYVTDGQLIPGGETDGQNFLPFDAVFDSGRDFFAMPP